MDTVVYCMNKLFFGSVEIDNANGAGNLALEIVRFTDNWKHISEKKFGNRNPEIYAQVNTARDKFHT